MKTLYNRTKTIFYCLDRKNTHTMVTCNRGYPLRQPLQLVNDTITYQCQKKRWNDFFDK